MKKQSKKKRSSRNFTIATRIAWSSALAIIIPLVIVVAFSSIMLSTMAAYFNFATVTTNSYSMLNQIQWSQTLASISTELISDDDSEEKVKEIKKFVSPLENLDSMIYIECNDKIFYSSSEKKNIVEQANSIVPINTDKNINHFGEDGIVIVNHAEKAQEKYLVIIVNKNYAVYDVSARYSAQNISSLMFGKTGLIILFVVLLFVLSIGILSIITSKTISRPLKKLAAGADEIAGGNLDYEIKYESTNEIGKTVKSFNDMTHRLKESLDEQNRIETSRKEMIAGAAHDLRTPLTSIKGYVEGLMDGIANTDEKRERYLKTIYNSTLDMEKLLNDLLTTSRLELGQIELVKERIRLNDFLSDCSDEIGLELEKQGFEFSYQNNCADDVFVDLDTDRFTRVIRNIISNSIKYSKKDTIGKIELAAEAYEKSVIISIADNGIGIDGSSLQKIFESFYRTDPARTKVREGSGLGLSVSKQIVELHGGHIWATSTEGEGLTLFISLERKIGENDEENTDC